MPTNQGDSFVFTMGRATAGLNATVVVDRKVTLQQLDYNNAYINTLSIYDKATVPLVTDIPKMVVRLPMGRHTFNYPEPVFENGIAFIIGSSPYNGNPAAPEAPTITGFNITYRDYQGNGGTGSGGTGGDPLFREASGVTDGFGNFGTMFTPPFTHTPHVDISFLNTSSLLVARLTAVSPTGCTVHVDQRELATVSGVEVLKATVTPAQNKFVSIRAY